MRNTKSLRSILIELERKEIYYDHQANEADNIDLDQLTWKNSKKVHWYCTKEHDHRFYASPSGLNSGNGCSCCAGKQIVWTNSFEYNHPEISKEWHPSLNGDLSPIDISCYSYIWIWWLCNKCGEEYKMRPASRVYENKKIKGRNCPFCSGYKVGKTNCLATKMPFLIAEWHPTLNGDITPYNTYYATHKQIWWKCTNCTEEYQMNLNKKYYRGDGCPYCAGKILGKFNTLAYKFPHIAAEWDYKLNFPLTPNDMTSKVKKRAWFVCPNGHKSYNTLIYSRTFSNSGCPICPTKVSLGETEWLDCLQVSIRQHKIQVNFFNKKRNVDGYDPNNNIVYEFHGDYYHAHPSLKQCMNRDVIHPNQINSKQQKTNAQIYADTLYREQKIKETGYKLVVIWEHEFNALKAMYGNDPQLFYQHIRSHAEYQLMYYNE